MKLLVMNPNTSATMTAQVAAEALRTAGAWLPPLQVRGVTAADGPAVIASRETFAAGAAAALRTLAAHDDGWADAVLLACFGDPGLDALRAASRVPVLGMAECALSEAVAMARPFHIITAGRAWDAMLRETVARHEGATALLDGITVLETTGLAVANDPEVFAARVQAALDAVQARGAPTCILAGSGFAAMRAGLRYGGVLLDGIDTAMRRLSQRPVTRPGS